ncbi:MAG: zinc-dependent metalloprotease, partial [Parvularculaceae bacterium]
ARRGRPFLIASALLVQIIGVSFAQEPSAPCAIRPNFPIDECLKTYDLEPVDKGLFRISKVANEDRVFLEISSRHLQEEFILFSYVENGVFELDGRSAVLRGDYRDAAIITFRKRNDTIDIVKQNTQYFYDPSSPLSRTESANVSMSILASLDIVGVASGADGEKRYLIELDDLFKEERLEAIFEGGLGRSFRSPDYRMVAVRNYENNSDFLIDYVFTLSSPERVSDAAVGDRRNFTIRMQHSIVARPKTGFAPRFADHRVGYFTETRTDLTTQSENRERDLITRWRLEAKASQSELSEPLKPITFWIENTTPHEFREIIRDAVLSWNAAFEKAGFQNAIEVKIQPDDADWSAGDIKYNVIRWVTSPPTSRHAHGYGPHFSDPLTGEILGADIVLDYGLFSAAIQKLTSQFADAEPKPEGDEGAELVAVSSKAAPRCELAGGFASSYQFARAAILAGGLAPAEVEKLTHQALADLVLHEVGHTLGLTHNFRASSWLDPRQIHDKELTKGAPVASVMDYTPANLAPPGVKQGDYYITRPGPYDLWAIEFGYRAPLENAEAEAARREALLSLSIRPEYALGVDTEVGGGDPRAMPWDMSSDAADYGVDRLRLIDKALAELAGRYSDEKDYRKLTNAFGAIQNERARITSIIMWQIGGVYSEKISPQQSRETGVSPYKAIPRAHQRDAMSALKTHIFSANALSVPADLARQLQRPRRGYLVYGPRDLVEDAFFIQISAVWYLTHPVLLNRMASSADYGGEYSPTEMLSGLNDAIFGGDLGFWGKPNATRRSLQLHYLARLVNAARDPFEAGVAARAAVNDISFRLMRPDFWLPPEIRAHRSRLRAVLKAI